MKRFNVGVVGYGWAAGAHINAINATSLAQVTAVCSTRSLDPTEFKRRHGVPVSVHHELDSMLAERSLDVISICSYPSDHPQQIIAAARAGKHLIIEKPLCLNPQDLASIRQAVKRAGVRACVCFELRYSSQFKTTKEVIDQGQLGRIHYGEIDYYHGIGPWYGQFRWNVRREVGGSSLLSAGCHALDALLLCMGTEVESISSFTTQSSNPDFAKYEYPSTSVTLLKFWDGSIGKVASCIDCLQPYYFHTHLVGSKGSLLDNKIYSTELPGPDKNKWSELPMKLCDSGDVSDHPYQSQLEAFFLALDAGVEMPLTSLADAAKTHELIFAAARSAELGEPVKLGPTN